MNSWNSRISNGPEAPLVSNHIPFWIFQASILEAKLFCGVLFLQDASCKKKKKSCGQISLENTS